MLKDADPLFHSLERTKRLIPCASSKIAKASRPSIEGIVSRGGGVNFSALNDGIVRKFWI